MKNRILNYSLIIVLVITSYYTYRLFIFAGKASKSFEYTYAAIACLIQETGQSESDIDIIFKGYKTRQSYANAANKEFSGLYPKNSPFLVRKLYNDQIPECHKFYTHYQCWSLDPHDPESLDGCGLHFGLKQEEIDIMKKTPSSVDKIMTLFWKRLREKK